MRESIQEIEQGTNAEYLSIAVLAVAIAMLFGPIVWGAVWGHAMYPDYPQHIEDAVSMFDSGEIRVTSPHFLFELIVGMISRFTALGPQSTATLVGLASYLALGLVLLTLVTVRVRVSVVPFANAALRISVVLGLMLAMPFNLLTLPANDLYFGYISTNPYHNPTFVLLRPLAVLQFLYAVHIFQEGDTRRSWQAVVVAALISVLSVTAKPSFVISLLPALGIYFLLHFVAQRKSIDWRLMVMGFGLPLVLILIGQFLFTYTGWTGEENKSRVILAPLLIQAHYSSLLLPKFILSILFPAAVYSLYWKTALRDKHLNLAWLAFAFGTLYTYFLAETGPRLFHGNFVWSGQITLFVLYVMSALFLLEQTALPNVDDASTAKSISLDPRAAICAAIFGLHLLSGIVWYFDQLPLYWYADQLTS